MRTRPAVVDKGQSDCSLARRRHISAVLAAAIAAPTAADDPLLVRHSPAVLDRRSPGRHAFHSPCRSTNLRPCWCHLRVSASEPAAALSLQLRPHEQTDVGSVILVNPGGATYAACLDSVHGLGGEPRGRKWHGAYRHAIDVLSCRNGVAQRDLGQLCPRRGYNVHFPVCHPCGHGSPRASILADGASAHRSDCAMHSHRRRPTTAPSDNSSQNCYGNSGESELSGHRKSPEHWLFHGAQPTGPSPAVNVSELRWQGVPVMSSTVTELSIRGSPTLCPSGRADRCCGPSWWSALWHSTSAATGCLEDTPASCLIPADG